MLNAEEILKRAEKKSKKFSHFQTKGLPSSGKDRPWQNNEVTPEKVTSITIKEDNIMNDNLKVPENQPNINREETGRKLVDNREKSGRKVVDNFCHNNETGRKVVEQPVDASEKSGRKVVEKWQKKEPIYPSIVGLQKSILFCIYNECTKARSSTTGCLTLEYISTTIKHSKEGIKNAIYHLEKKSFIERNSFKNGRGGWTKYTLPDWLFSEILQNETGRKLVEKCEKSGRKVVEQPVEQPVDALSSSSSIYNITTTNYSLDPQKSNLPEIWQKVDIDILQNIGFSESHLKQLVEKNIPECVEESLKHFAFGLLHNPKTKQYSDPLNVLMGVLRKGQAWVESNYKSQLEITTEEFLQRKKAEAERIAKHNQEIHNAEFIIWDGGLSSQEIEQIKTNPNYGGPLSVRKRVFFNEFIWPEIEKNLNKIKEE